MLAALKTQAALFNPAFVAQSACEALAKIAAIPTGQEACLTAGAVPAIVASLKAHGSLIQLNTTEDGIEYTETGIQESACQFLYRIAAGNPVCREACVAAGAVPVIVAVLKVHSSMATVAEYACWALSNITGDNSPAAKKACVAAGAVPAIVAALKANPSVADVAKRACGALANIAGGFPAGQEACVAAGAVPKIVTALNAYLSVEDVAMFACRAIRSITMNDNHVGKEACVAAGAVSAIVAALKANRSVADAAEWACQALMSIAANNHVGKVTCVAAGAVSELVAALKANRSVADAAEWACRALRNIAGISSGKAACESAKAAPQLAAVFRVHTGDARQIAHEVLDIIGYNDDGTKRK